MLAAMDVHITLSRRGELAANVYRQLRAAILDGRLRTGDRLPATRELAARLDVSRNTILDAFGLLVAEGFVVGNAGAGTYVAEATALVPRRAPEGSSLRPCRSWKLAAPSAGARHDVRHDFGIGAPDPALFPWDAWRSALAKQLRGRKRFAGYPAPEGEPALRTAIARHAGLARSVVAGAEDVIVTSGAQQAFDVVARVLVEPGATVAVEDPGYPPAHRAFAAAGARVVPIPVDAEGLDVARLPRETRLVYVTPSHQFPLGMPMSLPRRLALLAWAERHRAAIVEDDYDCELRFDGRPLEPLQSLDRSGRVLYVGTFSKTLLPTLRLGYLVAPAGIVPALRAAKQLADSHGPLEPQRALAALIDDGTFARHLRRVLRVYRGRRDRLLAALARHLPDFAPIAAPAGLHVAGWLPARTDAAALAARLLDDGVAVAPLAPYYRRRARAGLAFGFGLIAESAIDEGIRRVARALKTAPC